VNRFTAGRAGRPTPNILHRGTDPMKVKKAQQSICDILNDHSQALQSE
jgi:hypothetical protein